MKVLIAGGGTGGHLFPGIALAQEILTRAPNQHEVLFVGTKRGLEARVVPENGYALETIEISGMKHVGAWRFLKSAWAIPKALSQSLSILKRFKPDVVIGVGGYASGPVALAAWLSGIPVAIQEQNALPGFTNRLLGRFSEVVFTAFPEAANSFRKNRIQMLGNPIRRQLLDNYLVSSVPHEKFNLLVFGGSQGSHILNESMIEAVQYLDGARDCISILHQTGEKDLEAVNNGYAHYCNDFKVLPFINDMSAAYANADAIICRAGATTLAELTVARKAAILVPFAKAADNHQEINARSLVDSGAAVMVPEKELSGERLAKEIQELMDPGRRKLMEKAAGLLGRPQAAKEIADVLLDLASGQARSDSRDRQEKNVRSRDE